ncbi:MAG: 30S ribosomal protein S20 [Desulfarculales bacterium]|nr:30S ribosomal protein S20 [Desulfarculales bacterium]
MANHVSALKRAKQNEERRLRNKAYRTKVRNALKSVRLALAGEDRALVGQALRKASSIIDKVAGKGIIPRRTASRYVARLSAQAAKLNV